MAAGKTVICLDDNFPMEHEQGEMWVCPLCFYRARIGEPLDGIPGQPTDCG